MNVATLGPDPGLETTALAELTVNKIITLVTNFERGCSPTHNSELQRAITASFDVYQRICAEDNDSEEVISGTEVLTTLISPGDLSGLPCHDFEGLDNYNFSESTSGGAPALVNETCGIESGQGVDLQIRPNFEVLATTIAVGVPVEIEETLLDEDYEPVSPKASDSEESPVADKGTTYNKKRKRDAERKISNI